MRRAASTWLALLVTIGALAGARAARAADPRPAPVRVRYGEFAPATHNLAFFAAAAGEIDLGHVGTPAIVGIACGVPIRIVASPAVTWSPFALVVGRR